MRKVSPKRSVDPLPKNMGKAVRLEAGGSPYLGRLVKRDGPKVLDLFCGAGGLSLGFAQAGFHIVGGIDANPWAMETHAYNFGGNSEPTILSPEYTPEDALHDIGIGSVDVLIGGPPCQGFARVGMGKIRSLLRDRLTEPQILEWDDARNQLYKAYLRFVEVLKPRYLVMENVPDMVRHRDGATVGAVLVDLENKGYKAVPFVLDASHFGVPQTRTRLFIIANRTGQAVRAPAAVTEGNPVTLREAIGDLPVVRPEQSGDTLSYDGHAHSAYARAMRKGLTRDDRGVLYDHVVRRYAADDQAAFAYLAEGQRYRDLPNDLQRYRSDIFADKYHKLVWDRPAWTITAHIAKDGYKYIHPDVHQLRTITVREAARIQSFPDWFRFAGYRTNRFAQIGNAVPPLLAKSIALVVREQMNQS